MKYALTVLLSVVAMGFSAQAQNNPVPTTKDVVIGISDVFVPGGFDSSADAYVVVSGMFPNGCYRWKGASLKNVSDYEHEITSSASVSQGMCLMVLVPFSKDIRLGKLATGKHTLRFIGGDGTFLEKTLSVE